MQLGKAALRRGRLCRALELTERTSLRSRYAAVTAVFVVLVGGAALSAAAVVATDLLDVGWAGVMLRLGEVDRDVSVALEVPERARVRRGEKTIHEIHVHRALRIPWNEVRRVVIVIVVVVFIVIVVIVVTTCWAWRIASAAVKA